MMATNTGTVDSVVRRMDRVSGGLEIFVNRLDTLSKSVKSFADQLENNDGTLQMLVKDRALYDDLRKTANSLDELVVDIKANPRKYINLKVGIF